MYYYVCGRLQYYQAVCLSTNIVCVVVFVIYNIQGQLGALGIHDNCKSL